MTKLAFHTARGTWLSAASTPGSLPGAVVSEHGEQVAPRAHDEHAAEAEQHLGLERVVAPPPQRAEPGERCEDDEDGQAPTAPGSARRAG